MRRNVKASWQLVVVRKKLTVLILLRYPKEKAELGRAATVADKDEPAYVLRYGKPIAVVISNERYERLMSEGIDPSEH